MINIPWILVLAFVVLPSTGATKDKCDCGSLKALQAELRNAIKLQEASVIRLMNSARCMYQIEGLGTDKPRIATMGSAVGHSPVGSLEGGGKVYIDLTPLADATEC